MKAHDSLGFLIFGQMMMFLPALLPLHFPPTGIDGANTSALWLKFMGWVNTLTGSGILAHGVPAALARLLAWKPAVPPVAQPATVLRLAVRSYVRPETGARELAA